jgi:prevent-host-death family protein
VLTLPSTEVQNEFGRILDQASRNQDIVITRHNVARAVLISADRYRDLVGRDASVLESFRGQLDALYAGMQTAEADAAADRGFNASPQEMGRAAVEAARAVRRSAT